MADPLNDKIVAALDGVAGSPGLIWDVLPPLYAEKQWSSGCVSNTRPPPPPGAR